MKKMRSQRGFIALMSTIIIAAILLAMMGSTSFASFYARSDAQAGENKRSALAFAESCVNIALLALAKSTNPENYDPNGQSFDVGADSNGATQMCSIMNVAYSGTDVTINTYASVNDSFSTVSATATLPPSIKIISWKEY